MTTVIVQKKNKKINVYSDRLYQAQNRFTHELVEDDFFYDIKAIKVSDNLILFGTGDMTMFMTLSEAWRKHPDYLAQIKDKNMLLEEIVEVASNYAKIRQFEQLYALYIVSEQEVTDLNIGLNINPERPVSIIPTEYKITGTPQIYGNGRKMFNKPKKLSKLLNKNPETVFEKINANPDLGTSKEFDTLSIDL